MARKPAQNIEAAGTLTPGEHLRAEIERLGLDQVAVSKAAGVSRQSINNVINGRQPISRAMAGKLGRLTRRSSDYWLRESFPRNAKKQTGKARPIDGGVLVNHQIARAVTDGVIGIEPFIAKNLKAASINLTLGAVVTAADREEIDISSGKYFLLNPGQAVNVSTKERIEFALDYVGRVSTIYALGARGIMASVGFQVEPGFIGHIEFCMFNAGSSPFRLRAGEPIISLEIVRLVAAPLADPA